MGCTSAHGQQCFYPHHGGEQPIYLHHACTQQPATCLVLEYLLRTLTLGFLRMNLSRKATREWSCMGSPSYTYGWGEASAAEDEGA